MELLLHPACSSTALGRIIQRTVFSNYCYLLLGCQQKRWDHHLHLSVEINFRLPALGENRTHHAEHLLPLVQAELVLPALMSRLRCNNLSGIKFLFCVQNCKDMTFASSAPKCCNYNYIHLQNISPAVWYWHSETYWQRVKFGMKLTVKEPHTYISSMPPNA